MDAPHRQPQNTVLHYVTYSFKSVIKKLLQQPINFVNDQHTFKWSILAIEDHNMTSPRVHSDHNQSAWVTLMQPAEEDREQEDHQTGSGKIKKDYLSSGL